MKKKLTGKRAMTEVVRNPYKLLLLAALSLLAYWPFLSLPYISDDYIQLDLGRRYGPIDAWPALAGDALYRCRATSIVLTFWTEQLFGRDNLVLNVSSLVLHVFNSLLLFALGAWRRVGYKVSFAAACIFAVYQRPQEAVVWYAALPELLVFTFVVLGLYAWIQFIQRSQRYWFAFTAVAFILALLSKESGVVLVPLAAGVACIERMPWRRAALCLLPLAAIAVIYYFAAREASATHLHFNDGTFVLSWSFVPVIVRSVGRMFWVWGLIASLYLLYANRARFASIIGAALVWMAIALGPYAFLTYQGAVPSRHTYLAS
ncbi:MAG: glycosyltransferase family 39 protein, partial [Acidobacteria bacterium]|nr:glycosyltransferase family 39 protein [Acidobacteriota bacterium]